MRLKVFMLYLLSYIETIQVAANHNSEISKRRRGCDAFLIVTTTRAVKLKIIKLPVTFERLACAVAAMKYDGAQNNSGA